MYCSACLTEYPLSYAWCPRCGASLAATPPPARDSADNVIEGTIVEYGASGDGLPADGADTVGDEDRPIMAQTATPSTSLIVARPALPSLPARLWRQPAVRAVARASAGALALTLGMRVLRGALMRPHVTSQLAGSALPALRQMFDARSPARRPVLPATGDDNADVVETFIYIRRVVRRQ